MFGKKKEEAGLPNLPPSNTPFHQRKEALKRDVESDYERSALPAFPDSPNERGFSQSAIKDAVGSRQNMNTHQMPAFPDENESGGSMEMQEWEPTMHGDDMSMPVSNQSDNLGNLPEPPRHDEKPSFATPNDEVRRMGRQHFEEGIQTVNKSMPVKATNDVFVKIDKFHTARKTLREVTNKLEEIDELIKKIRDTKLREEQELSNWERDVTHIRARVKGVTENIFEKVD